MKTGAARLALTAASARGRLTGLVHTGAPTRPVIHPAGGTVRCRDTVPVRRPGRSLKVPGCSAAVAPARTLAGVRPVTTTVPPAPFGVITSPDGRMLYVTNFASGQLESIPVAGLVRAANP